MAADVEWWCHLMTSDDSSRSVPARGDKTNTHVARFGACDVISLTDSQAKWIEGRQARLVGMCGWDLSWESRIFSVGCESSRSHCRAWWCVRLLLEVGFLGFGRDMPWSMSVLLVLLGKGLMCTNQIGRGTDCLVVGFWHSTEPWWLRDAVESRSSRQTCVTFDGDVHVRIFFFC